MTAARKSSPPGAVVYRGRIDKQRAVLAAAFTVFARAGYAQARMDEIAAEAEVAKATVYNHFGDKETVFRQVVQALSESALAANLAAVELLVHDSDDLEYTFGQVGRHLVDCYCGEESRALRRLLCAEAAQFPDLLDLVDEVSRRVTRTLADRLARLALAGRLRIGDPETAAIQFAALLAGSVDIRSRLGTRSISDTERQAIADAAAATFSRAFGVEPFQPGVPRAT
ncbi:TetR/AcrR family transcriptional regulator [Nocardia noduli]|uniref:TetR/AcrR family transcriptional regulator n=1 Tax=Nocardia noduli TaxID=2815722 RepID=UPI001C235A9A|nr:TetR/AcrR family transcriptional regulator [Nocardia noduli]